jgi:hypothetical protein
MLREIEVTLVGTSPLLMNNIKGMPNDKGGKTAIRSTEEKIAGALYWIDDEHTSLGVPDRNIHACLAKAGAKFKANKVSLSTLIVSAIHIKPEMISLNRTDYQIDERSVVIKATKGRIFQVRPKIPTGWQLTFVMEFDDEWLSVDVMERIFPEVIKTAGKLVGILDYRVEKKGQFGCFRLARYELLPLRQQSIIPEPEIIGFSDGLEKKNARKKAA